MWSPSLRIRIFRIMAFSFATTLSANIMNPGLFGYKVLEIAPTGFHNTFLGLLTFVWSIITVFNLPLVGAFSDQTHTRYGKRFPFFVLGALGMSGAAFAVAYAPTMDGLLLAVIFLSIFDNTIIAPWLAYYREETPATFRGEAAGYKALVDILGVVLGRQIAGSILANTSPANEALLVWLPACIAAALLLSLWATPRSQSVYIPAQAIRPRVSLRVNLRAIFALNLKAHPDFGWWLVNRFFFWMAFIIIGTFTLFYALDALDLDPAAAQRMVANLTTIIGVAILSIAIPAGRLADRLGRKPLIFWACMLAAAGTALLLLQPGQAGIWLAGILVGVGAGTYMSANLALLADVVPAEASAHYFGIAGVASALGGALARLLGGLIVDPLNLITGSRSFGHLVLFGLASLFFFLSGLAILRIQAVHSRTVDIDSPPILG